MATQNYILTNQFFTDIKQTEGYIHANQSNKNQLNVSYLKVVAVTQPFPRNGGMVEDHEAPEAGKLDQRS